MSTTKIWCLKLSMHAFLEFQFPQYNFSCDIAILLRLQFGYTPLHYVCESGNTEFLKLLIKWNAQIDVPAKVFNNVILAVYARIYDCSIY